MPEPTAQRVAAVYARLSGLEPLSVENALCGRSHALGPEAASSTEEFCAALDRLGLLGGTVGDTLDRLAAGLGEHARAVRLFRAAVRAATLEGYLCPFEGKRSVDFDPPTESGPAAFWVAWGRTLRRRADELPVRSRWTPFLAHTDDTQYLVTGVRAGLREDGNAPDALLDEWRGYGRHQAWRNIGRRTRGFLESGEPSRLAGEATFGDLLRGASVFLCSETIGTGSPLADWQAFARHAGLAPGQREAVGAFLAALDRSLDGDRAVSRSVRRLAALFPLRIGANNLFGVVDDTLVDRAAPHDFAARLPTVGSDHDTFGFLSGLLSSEQAIPLGALSRPLGDEQAARGAGRLLAECSARAVGYFLVASARAAGVRIEMPDDYAEATMVAEQQFNYALTALREHRGPGGP